MQRFFFFLFATYIVQISNGPSDKKLINSRTLIIVMITMVQYIYFPYIVLRRRSVWALRRKRGMEEAAKRRREEIVLACIILGTLQWRSLSTYVTGDQENTATYVQLWTDG